ncbi:hypothetical protein [Phytomonospora endophytica]|uniref:Uncharacterized protein n=1 Tax=Phytomonospora endophytica TaxID=714109 RepID=A0A841FNN7_9ACTN|nr:hypothetical protein [Phytomonospora endophytica]MBB6037695.1 hypothetical protein [Phytomonospora endophytica]GIG67778.1 hypothetical protein Pen01_40730 [Phytomonospora endophytica]
MRIPLSEAVDRYRREPRAHSNAYDWYRNSARQYGAVSLGGHRIPAVKVGRQWMVDEEDVEHALTAWRAELANLVQMTADYQSRVLHTGTVRIDGGGYTVQGAFHFVWNDRSRALHDSDGAWKCNTYWTSASQERGREECHRCRDWRPCGKDCTVSRIFCSTCGASQPR